MPPAVESTPLVQPVDAESREQTEQEIQDMQGTRLLVGVERAGNHRNILWEKLDLKNKGVKLQVFLMNMGKQEGNP
jgi:hypothetical protein